jgi:glucose/mannose-6-phosphate isomerase
VPANRTPGAETMRALAVQLPVQLEDGFRAGRELGQEIPRTVRCAWAAGMGGSAIAADLLRTLTDSETDITLSIVRGPGLPRAVRESDPVVLVSYSGNTWETLAAYDEAGRRSARRLVFTSGGELAHRAIRDGVPHFPVPPGLPPRSAVGFLLGGLLGVVDAFFPESNEERVRRVASRIAERQAELSRATGPAGRLAERVGRRSPYVYATSNLEPLARRWKTQVEENAKRVAQFDILPELFHNAIVGWDAIPRADAARRAVIFLDAHSGPPNVAAGRKYLEQVLKRRGVVAAVVDLPAEDGLEALMTGVTLGDHFSLFLAAQAKVDPYPVDALTGLKRALGGPAIESGARSPPRS